MQAPRRATGLCALLAAATFAFAAPAGAQQRPGAAFEAQLGRAAEEVFRALDRNRGTEAYFDAMEAATDALYDHGLIAASVERFYDRQESRSDWNWSGQRNLAAPRYHDLVMDVLRRSRGTEGYYEAMEAAADELEGEDMVSDATEEFFDRMTRRTGWGEYGYRRGDAPDYAGTWR